MARTMMAFMEFFVVIAFGIGFLILEWRLRHIGRKLDEAREAERKAQETAAAQD